MDEGIRLLERMRAAALIRQRGFGSDGADGGDDAEDRGSYNFV